jgi:steroid delta-isomerase-like uncharacterized protein
MPSTAELKSLIQRMEVAMNERKLDDLDEILAEDFVRHCEATPHLDIRSREQFKDFLRDFDAAFPDNVQTFTRVAAEGDQIGILATYEGTHQGQLWDIPATGKPVKFTFAGMFRVADGRLAEFWITWDNVTILSQLGLMPA